MTEIVLFVLGVGIGGATTWWFSHVYYKKSTRDLQDRIDELTEDLRPKNTLQDFEKFLDASEWREQLVDQSTIWVCDSDNTFQIARSEDESEPFDEPWVHHYPNSAAYATYVHLKINGNPIKQIRFITLDGGRIFVPMPEQRVIGSERKYFWISDAINFKVGKRIGSFYIYNSMERIATTSRIEILSSQELSRLDGDVADERLGRSG
jgi:hypothetical protein